MLENRLSAEEESAALRSMTSELSFLLTSHGIPEAIQAKIAHLGYSDVFVFSKIQSSDEKVRRVLELDVGLKESGGPGSRAMICRMLAAWETPQKRTDRRRQEEAEQRVGDLPRTLPRSSHLELVRGFARAHFVLPEKLTPAPAYLEWRLEELEDGELQAESLEKVFSRADVAHESRGIFQLRPDGTLRQHKIAVESALPATPEHLRAKVRLMCYAWEFMRLRFPDKPLFQGLSFAVWDRYIEFLLGEEVYEACVRDAAGGTVFRPSWAQLTSATRRRPRPCARRSSVRAELLVGPKGCHAETRSAHSQDLNLRRAFMGNSRPQLCRLPWSR